MFFVVQVVLVLTSPKDEELPFNLKQQFGEWWSQLRYIPRIFIDRYYCIDTQILKQQN